MTQIKLRRDTAANFTSKNPILGNGEPAYETDTKKLKIGDGTTAYTQLEYFSAGGGGSTNISATLPLKIVNGMISLEVDGQTIQVVDGELHGNNNIFDIGKFEVVGSPTITDDGIASGFTTSSTIRPPAPYNNSGFLNVTKSWGITIKIQYLSADTDHRGLFLHYQFPFNGHIGINPTMAGLWGAPIGGNEGAIVFESLTNLGISDGDFVNIRVTFDVETLTYALYASKNDEPLSFRKSVVKTGNLTVANSTQEVKFACYDDGGYRHDFNGSIDLKQFSITVDGQEVFNGLMSSTKPIYDAIKASNTELSEFKTETSNDFSAVDSVLNEKANLSDLALKQNKLTAGDNVTLTNLTDGTVRIDATSSGLEVGDIGMALYVDETKGLRRYLNGQIVDINTNTQAFLNRLKEITTLHPSLLCTEDEWQTAKTMSTFGQVGKFVFNYSGGEVISVRIPRVVNVQGLFDLQNLGMTVSAGLPNIEGSITGNRLFGQYASLMSSAGALKLSTVGSASSYLPSNSNNFSNGFSFDASDSNPIYGNSNTVQQEAIQYPYFIQIATGSETENNIINEIELNNPYSLFDSKYSDHKLNNLSWLKSEGQWNAKAVYPTAYDKLLKVQNGTETVEGLSVKLSTETYTDYDFVLNTAEETFRLPLLDGSENLIGDKYTRYEIGPSGQEYTATHNGYVSVTKSVGKGTVDLYNSTQGHINSTCFMFYATTESIVKASIKVNRGDKFIFQYTVPTTNSYSSMILRHNKGNGSLYYYVGETVQNANLIDAGRIGEQLTGKVDVSNTQWATNACMPDYSAGVPLTKEIDYTAPTDGYIMVSATTSKNQSGSTFIFKIDNTTILNRSMYTYSGVEAGVGREFCIPVSKGSVANLTTSGIVNTYMFYPLKGAN